MCLRIGQIVKCEDIIKNVWGKSPYGTQQNLGARMLDLRNKLKYAPKGQQFIIYQVKEDRNLVGYIMTYFTQAN